MNNYITINNLKHPVLKNGPVKLLVREISPLLAHRTAIRFTNYNTRILPDYEERQALLREF